MSGLNVRTAIEHIERRSGRDGSGHRGDQIRLVEFLDDFLRVLAEQHGERVLHRGYLGVRGCDFRFERAQFPFCEGQIQLIGDSAVVANIHEAQRIPQDVAGIAQ